jgi:hypothetical protein
VLHPKAKRREPFHPLVKGKTVASLIESDSCMLASENPKVKQSSLDFEREAVWAARAGELADWAQARLVNRVDAWGGYRPPHEVGQEYVDRNGKKGKLGLLTTRKGTLTHTVLARHFKPAKRVHLVGLHSTSPTNTSKWGGVDIDWHGESSTAPEINLRAAMAWYSALRSRYGFHPLLTDSNGAGGYHLVLLLAEPTPTWRVYEFLGRLVSDHHAYGMKAPPETFPKQPRVTEKNPYGNWLRLMGRHHTRMHWSRVWDGQRWLDGDLAIDFILALTGDDPALVPNVPPPAPPPPRPARRASSPYPSGVVTTRGNLSARIARRMARLPNLAEGQGRHKIAYNFACWLVRDMALADDAALQWLEMWDEKNSPPKGRDLLIEIIASAHKYGKNSIGCGLPPERPRYGRRGHIILKVTGEVF